MSAGNLKGAEGVGDARGKGDTVHIDDVVFVYQLKTPELVRWHSRRHSHGDPQFELHYFLRGGRPL